MKKLQFWLCIILSLLLACSVMMPATAKDNAPAAVAVSTEITDVFSMEQFSNAAVNDFLKVFPNWTAAFEESFSNIANAATYVNMETDELSISGPLTLYYDGAQGTDRFETFLNAAGIRVYPQSLGNYLLHTPYSAVGNALLTNGSSWYDYLDADDEFAFSFDWGLDAITDPAEKYNAFLQVIAVLIDAARPVFTTALGTTLYTIPFSGTGSGQNLFCAAITVRRPL